MHIVVSDSAAARLDAARQFVLRVPPASEILIVSASRGAADDFARAGRARPRRDVRPLPLQPDAAGRALAAPLLARERLSPTTGARRRRRWRRGRCSTRTATRALTYFAPVAAMPGFPARARAHARGAGARRRRAAALAACRRRRRATWPRCSSVSTSSFSRRRRSTARPFSAPRPTRRPTRQRAVRAAAASCCSTWPMTNAAERAFVDALVARAPDAFATDPGRRRARRATALAVARRRSTTARSRRAAQGSSACAATCLPPSAPPPGEPLDEVELFSAPGEGREAVEIARRVLREARRGVPFDRMAIALRAPQHYAGLLEHALERAGVPGVLRARHAAAASGRPGVSRR